MTDWLDVDTDGVRRHAGRVEQVRRGVDQAADAAGQVGLHGGALGILCTPLLLPAFAPVEAAGRAAVDAAGESLTGTAHALRRMADTYDAVDEAVTEVVELLQRWQP